MVQPGPAWQCLSYISAAPQAKIIGAPDMHVDMGSTINLTCTISHTPEPPTYIYWYHNSEVSITAEAPLSFFYKNISGEMCATASTDS